MVVGYAVYAAGLMALVVLWYVRGPGLSGIAQHLLNLGALITLAWLVAVVTARVAGPVRSKACLFLAVVVGVMAAANLVLGVAVEPPWYTALAAGLGVAALVRARWLGGADERPDAG